MARVVCYDVALSMASLDVQITCPNCSYVGTETMPVDRCVFFYECGGCHKVLKPKAGDCCVYCSYGNRRCPFRQDGIACPDGSPL